MKAEKEKKTRILIVDDHPMTRDGLVHLINHQPEMVVDGEAEDAAQALDLLASKRPDLMLIDITLPGKSGLELIKDVKAMRPRSADAGALDARRIFVCRSRPQSRRSRLYH